jgi:hypothetical protein
MIKNIIGISDTHCGCKLGLFPPNFTLNENVKVEQSPLQVKLWALWLDFWVWAKASCKGQDYIIVHNGDIIDGVHHNSTTQITQNKDDQRRIAVEVMKPVLSAKHCKGYIQINGTTVHSGQSGEDEEAVARELKAIPQDGRYSRYEAYIRFGEDDQFLSHWTHHIGTTNSAAYETTALMKELVEANTVAARWGLMPPDVLVRSHRHIGDEIKQPSRNTNSIVVVTPGWQAKTPFVFRGVMGRNSLPQFGGIIVKVGADGVPYVLSKTYTIERTKETKL